MKDPADWLLVIALILGIGSCSMCSMEEKRRQDSIRLTETIDVGTVIDSKSFSRHSFFGVTKGIPI